MREHPPGLMNCNKMVALPDDAWRILHFLFVPRLLSQRHVFCRRLNLRNLRENDELLAGSASIIWLHGAAIDQYLFLTKQTIDKGKRVFPEKFSDYSVCSPSFVVDAEHAYIWF
ncbi:MAG: hypothetical protein N2067_09285 [Spirochaetaceae bacterium]|nr:hypothetical protein [Spirochaetaceae bacterium]